MSLLTLYTDWHLLLSKVANIFHSYSRLLNAVEYFHSRLEYLLRELRVYS